LIICKTTFKTHDAEEKRKLTIGELTAKLIADKAAMTELGNESKIAFFDKMDVSILQTKTLSPSFQQMIDNIKFEGMVNNPDYRQ